MAQCGAICACRESFVPFSPPRSQAGRILYRTRGRVGASHDSTPSPTSAEGTGGRRRNRPRCKLRPVVRASIGWRGDWRAPEKPEGPNGLATASAASRGSRVTAITTPAKVAHNSPRSFFKTTRKRCNSNDTNSMFEQAAGELRAKLLWRGAEAETGRTTSRHAERSSPRGRNAGGPPPTGTHSGQAQRPDPTAPETPATPHTPATRPPGHATRAGTPHERARHTSGHATRAGTPKGRVPKYPPLVDSLSHCLVEAQAEWMSVLATATLLRSL